jgi:hypothetical protein
VQQLGCTKEITVLQRCYGIWQLQLLPKQVLMSAPVLQLRGVMNWMVGWQS